MHRNVIEFSSTRDGAARRLESRQFLPVRREKVFDFFSDAHQLESLTPPWLQFCVLTRRPIRIQEGTCIDYQLRLHGVPIRWQSSIEVWEPPHRFVDVQTRGPYRSWRHEHVLEEVAGGTICRDVVDYAVLGGWLVDRFLVRNDVRRIFEFRQCKLNELFARPDGR